MNAISSHTATSPQLMSHGETGKDLVFEVLATACVLTAGLLFVAPFIVVAAGMSLVVFG